MPIFSVKEFIATLDGYFATEDLKGASNYLKEQYIVCNQQNNENGKLTVLNEMIGFYRQTGEGEAALEAIDEALALIEKSGISTEISGATIYLNCATTLKCFGKPAESIQYYQKTKDVYDKRLSGNHPLVAGLYNNMALALQDIGSIDESEEYFRKAIEITLSDKKQMLECAVSYMNLSHLLFDKDPVDDEINELLDKAYEILMNPEYFGYDKYAFTCRKCAPSFGYFGRFIQEKEIKGRADTVYAGYRNQQKIL